MKVYHRAVILAALLLATTVVARAQGGGNSPAAVASKVGVLNVRQAIVNTAEGKQAAAELQSQFAARQTDLDNLRKQIEDVQSRFGRTIDDFLAAPTGTMSVVLSRQIILSPAEKTVAIEKLRDAFKEYQNQRSHK